MTKKSCSLPMPTWWMKRSVLAMVQHKCTVPKELYVFEQRCCVRGRVKLALASSFAIQIAIPLLLPALRREHPSLRVDLHVNERAADLGNREAEIAVRFFKPTRGDLVTKRVAKLPLAVLAHHRYAKMCSKDPHTWDWIVLEPGLADEAAMLRTFKVREPALRTNMHLAQIEAVRTGLGVALLPQALTLLSPELTPMPVDMGAPTVEVWLATPRVLAKQARVRALWLFLERALGRLENGTLLELT